MASIVADKVFERFPNVRIATIETGSEWVAPLLKKLRNVSTQMPGEFAEDPPRALPRARVGLAVLRGRRVALVDEVGTSRVVFGSDYPHVEGLAEPAAFAKEIDQLPATTSAGSCGTTPGTS